MRATSPPIALTVAAAAVVAAVLMPLGIPSSALAERWLRPVPGEVARAFSYARAAPFERGAHRGVDLAAAPGAPVRSACAGTVVHAGPVALAGRVVSVRCGVRRVTYLPLARVAVRAGAAIRAGAPIGTVAAGHGGLHLGVRREADRFGYEDPLALLAPHRRAPRGPGPAPRARPPRRTPRLDAPRVPAARPAALPRVAPIAPRGAPAAPDAVPAPPRGAPAPPRGAPAPPRGAPAPPRGAPAPPRGAPAPPRGAPATPRGAPGPALGVEPARPASAPRGVAPWPVWAGLGLLLAGVAGSGTLVVRRRRAARAPVAAADTLGRAA